ncbi:hypothetical protein C8F01DRAFT_1233998 [Mycena amicta]|nr:hypothetical protein C8F01DRAFT_1233998 [Mycena amicta]
MYSSRWSDGFQVTVPAADAPLPTVCDETDPEILQATLRSLKRLVKGPQGNERWTVSMDVTLLQGLVWYHETESDSTRARSKRSRTVRRNAFVAHMSGQGEAGGSQKDARSCRRQLPVRSLINFSEDLAALVLPAWMTVFDRTTPTSTPEPETHQERRYHVHGVYLPSSHYALYPELDGHVHRVEHAGSANAEQKQWTLASPATWKCFPIDFGSAVSITMVEPHPLCSRRRIQPSDAINVPSGVMYGSAASHGWSLASSGVLASQGADDSDDHVNSSAPRPRTLPTIFFFNLGWKGVELNLPPLGEPMDKPFIPLVNINFFPPADCVAIVTGEYYINVACSQQRFRTHAPHLRGRSERVGQDSDEEPVHSATAGESVVSPKNVFPERIRYDSVPWVPVVREGADVLCEGALLRCNVALVAVVNSVSMTDEGNLYPIVSSFKLKSSAVNRCYRRHSGQPQPADRQFVDLTAGSQEETATDRSRLMPPKKTSSLAVGPAFPELPDLFLFASPLKMDQLRLDIQATSCEDEHTVPLLAQMGTTYDFFVAGPACSDSAKVVLALGPPVRGSLGVKRLFQIAAVNLAKITDTHGPIAQQRRGWVEIAENSDNTRVFVQCNHNTLKMHRLHAGIPWLPVEGGTKPILAEGGILTCTATLSAVLCDGEREQSEGTIKTWVLDATTITRCYRTARRQSPRLHTIRSLAAKQTKSSFYASG